MPVKILHISDIHFSSVSETPHDPDATYRDALVEKVRESGQAQPFNCIFFTGDVAARGAASEYAIAARWLGSLAQIAGCGKKAIYVVPGNHDVDRGVTRDNVMVGLAQAAVVGAKNDGAREAALKRVLASPETGPGLFRPIENYNKFATDYECEIGPDEAGVWTRWLVLDHGYRLKIFGMTSILFSSCAPPGDDDTRAQNLYVGPFQQTLRFQPGEVVATLIHHPADWLLDTTAQNRALRNRSTLHFEGHVHDRDVLRTDTQVKFSAGAVSPNRHEQGFEPGFNILSLDVVPDNDGKYHLDIDAEVWAWQENPGRFRLHQTATGDDHWHHRLALRTIPANAEPMVATDRLPPPVPAETSGIGPAIQRFWTLSGSAKARVAGGLELLTEDEKRLPERYRYTNMFKRAVAQKKTDALVEAIRNEESKA